ncbi:hypothetical protein HG531_004620 [Fusarium graminearum]|nr:hypothetical protein HG531_004620 [Fusarium graminearum]
MISQTYIVAFITAYLVAGSQAGPCKPSSRITESLVTSDVSTTIGSATATSSVETTTVASSSTYLSNEESSVIITESVSSTETSLPSEETSTTALSTTEGTTTEIATTTEAVTATATTTTSEEPSTIPFIGNGGFDDYDSSIEPWRKYGDVDALSIDSDIKHDGRYSARIEILGHSLLQYSIAQPLRGSITAGVTYTMSAHVYLVIALDTAIGLSILAKAIVLSGLVIAAVVAGALETSTAAAARGLSALDTSFMGVNLAMSELASADAAVGLAILAETVVLCCEC